MRQIGTLCSRNFYDGKNGRTKLTRRPIKRRGTRYSEIFCSGKLCRKSRLLDNHFIFCPLAAPPMLARADEVIE